MNKEEYETKKIKTLYIDRSSSQCGACGRGADPYERKHDTILEYMGSSEGCHVEWEYVSSNYMGMPDLVQSIKRMRPDLEFWQ